MSNLSIINDIQSYAETLRLNVIKSYIQEAIDEIDDAVTNNLGYDEFLYLLLQTSTTYNSIT